MSKSQSKTPKSTPAELGFAIPPEWSPHAATWAAWPREDGTWCGTLAAAQRDFAQFLNTLAAFEPVQVLCSDDGAVAEARASLASAITLHPLPYQDLWLRDSGPIFLTRNLGGEPGGEPGEEPGEEPGARAELVAVNWEFNAWGDRYPWALDNQIPMRLAQQLGLYLFHPGIVLEGGSVEVNGAGLCLTTQQCLLTPTRNPSLTQPEIEQSLQHYLGVTEVVWLAEGLEGDHTDGHIDTITRFVDEQTLVTSVCEDRGDRNFAPMQANLEQLKAFRSRSGQGLRVVPLPLPQQRVDFQGERLPLTYANFYIANGAVLVPTYDDPQDAVALEILQDCFRDRSVIGLPARGLIHGGGAFHCATQQQPLGRFWSPQE